MSAEVLVPVVSSISPKPWASQTKPPSASISSKNKSAELLVTDIFCSCAILAENLETKFWATSAPDTLK
jgi:hypothetical protein